MPNEMNPENDLLVEALRLEEILLHNSLLDFSDEPLLKNVHGVFVLVYQYHTIVKHLRHKVLLMSGDTSKEYVATKKLEHVKRILENYRGLAPTKTTGVSMFRDIEEAVLGE